MATVIIQTRKRVNRNSYIVYFKDPSTGERKYYKTYQKKREAQVAANDLRTLLDSGHINNVKKAKLKRSTATFNEVADVLEKAWGVKLAEGNLRAVTLDIYKYILGVLRNHFGDQLLFQITVEDIVSYRLDVAELTSRVNANRRLFVIKQVFKKALELGIVPEDLTAGIKYLSEKAHVRNKYLIADELRLLVDGTLQTRAKHYLPAIIWLAAEHGASHQEILDLRWNDVILDGDQEQIRFLRTKNGKERTFLKIGPESKKALIHWREHLAESRRKRRIEVVDKSGFIFSRLNGRPIKGFRSAWETAKLNAGLDDFHFHDLRHTFCSNLALAGANLKDIKEMIGHDDISMTDRYTHLVANRQESLQNMLFEQYGVPTVSGTGSGEHIGNTESI